MAEPNTIKVGDVVTHPNWPAGTTRTVLGLSAFKREGWVGKRRKLIDDPRRVICHLDGEPVKEIDDPDGFADTSWMELGLQVIRSAP